VCLGLRNFRARHVNTDLKNRTSPPHGRNSTSHETCPLPLTPQRKMIQKELAMNWHDPLPTTAPISRRLAAVILTCGLLASLPVLAQTPPPLGDAELVKALRAGGLVILLRHGATFSDQTDKVPFNFDDLASQRNLNDKGKALARSF
jgi:hypothetical protein